MPSLFAKQFATHFAECVHERRDLMLQCFKASLLLAFTELPSLPNPSAKQHYLTYPFLMYPFFMTFQEDEQ